MACVTACILDPYHVSSEGFDGHYEHKKDHKCIEHSLETLWCLSTKKTFTWHLDFMKAMSHR